MAQNTEANVIDCTSSLNTDEIQVVIYRTGKIRHRIYNNPSRLNLYRLAIAIYNLAKNHKVTIFPGAIPGIIGWKAIRNAKETSNHSQD